jgi:hypothetical protein
VVVLGLFSTRVVKAVTTTPESASPASCTVLAFLSA